MHALRIGDQISGRTESDPVEIARRAEELGFDVVLAGDHVGPGLPTLAAIAAATATIRLGRTMQAGHMNRCNERSALSYFFDRELDSFAPVLDRLGRIS